VGVTNGGPGWRVTPTAKAIWIFIASPLVCIGVGTIIGAAAFALSSFVHWGADATAGTLLQAYLVSLLYGLLVTVPFGGAAGIVAALIINALGKGSYRGASLKRWLRAGAPFGGGVGVACPVFFGALGFGGDGSIVEWFLFYAIAGGTAGLVAGVALAALAWREYGERTA
jgi:hypothetical protein